MQKSIKKLEEFSKQKGCDARLLFKNGVTAVLEVMDLNYQKIPFPCYRGEGYGHTVEQAVESAFEALAGAEKQYQEQLHLQKRYEELTEKKVGSLGLVVNG